MDDCLVDHWFSYHAPTDDEIPKHAELMDAARNYARVANRLLPECADKTAALRQLRMASMAFADALACNHLPVESPR